MKRFLAPLLALGLTVAACSPTMISGLASTSVGQSLLNAMVDTLAPGVNAAIAKGVAAAGPELATMAYALPWARAALDFFGLAAGISLVTLAQLDVDIVNAETLLANPPTTVAAAVADATMVWQEVSAALQPAVAAH